MPPKVTILGLVWLIVLLPGELYIFDRLRVDALQSWPPSLLRQRASWGCVSATAASSNEPNELPQQQQQQQQEEADETFLRRELARLETLEDLLRELEEEENLGDWDGLDSAEDLTEQEEEDDDGDDEVDYDMDHEVAEDFEHELEDESIIWDKDSLMELFDSVPDDDDDVDEMAENETATEAYAGTPKAISRPSIPSSAAAGLEKALMQGVVPVSAGVGSDCLVGDFGFDPLDLASKDYFRPTQNFLLRLLPSTGDDSQEELSITKSTPPRPKALILRDYREAEIRHGRLAMLAAIFWPLQEMLDRLLLDEDQFGPLLYGPITLPYFPLLMTAIMLLLAYLDIYSQAVKEMDRIGEAFQPGDCFWDPLKILDGATDFAKRTMQERELFNGRVAMLAVAAYVWEEAWTHLPLVSIEANQILLEPAFQVPFVQRWLDSQFALRDPLSSYGGGDYAPMDELNGILEEFADSM